MGCSRCRESLQEVEQLQVSKLLGYLARHGKILKSDLLR